MPLENPIDPDLPIVDPHHHLWYIPPAHLAAMQLDATPALQALGGIFSKRPRYLFDDFVADIATCGHDIRATVFLQVHTMYRRDGPEELRSVGEVEFANGVGAMADSGLFGETRICAGIVGGVDLRMGDRMEAVLDAQGGAGGRRYRGVRPIGTAHEPSLPEFNAALGSTPALLADPDFRAGAKRVAGRGLSLDLYVVEPQLGEVVDFARALPELSIVLDHLGAPIGYGDRANANHERLGEWRTAIRAVASCPNVTVKLGGFGNGICGLPTTRAGGTTSEALAADWRPYMETAIEAFGVERCMFESNYPVDLATADYGTIWNAFKRIAAGVSAEEKASLFAGTAARVYRLDL
jgi:L-fuconolactonase